MPAQQRSKYFWPSSGLLPSDMDLLYRAREFSPRRQPITKLIAIAVRETYGHLAACRQAETEQLREAA